ncbi:glycosyltransferase family 2 protein [soil metagenome]
MKVSIITVVHNRVATIEKAMISVLQQSYSPIEYIVIDGNSNDGTQAKVRSFDNYITKFISAPDKGMYDALNKGIEMASGDIIGVLHSDDFFADETIVEQIAEAFKADQSLDAVYGDVSFVNANDHNKITRYYSSEKFNNSKFEFGYMPAHPSFFCRRECFEKFGNYRTDMKIAADFELLLRFLAIHNIRSKYLPVCTTIMSTGGKSTAGLRSIITINKEFNQALKEHGFKTSMIKLYSRYFIKWKEFFGN